MKKIIALFLCLIMIASALTFAACGDNEQETDTVQESESLTEAPIQDADGNYIDAVPDGLNFGGRDFIITCPWPDYWGINNYDVQELTSDTVYDEVYYRNRKMENRFNVKISAFELGTTDTCVESLSPYILADTGAFDLICFAFSTGSTGLISGGLLATWNDVPYIDYSKPWWNSSCTETGTMNGKVYFNAGSFNWFTSAMAYCFFFNDRIRTENNIDDLYAMVDNGEWTLDKLQELCRIAAKDLDSNGKWNGKDQYGLVCTSICGDVMTIGCGFQHVNKNDDGTFTVNVGNEQHQQILNKVYNIFKRDNHIAYSLGGNKMFSDGQTLFYLDFVYSSTYFREMEDDFGIIPMPKFDENQEQYYSYADSWGLANALPICTKPEDYEMFGALLEALSVESLNKLYPAYYEYTLKGRDTRDTDSWRMLDLINSTLVYDFGTFFVDGGSEDSKIFSFQKLLRYGKESTDLASYRAQYYDGWLEHYGKIMQFGLDVQ